MPEQAEGLRSVDFGILSVGDSVVFTTLGGYEYRITVRKGPKEGNRFPEEMFVSGGKFSRKGVQIMGVVRFLKDEKSRVAVNSIVVGRPFLLITSDKAKHPFSEVESIEVVRERESSRMAS